MRRVWRRSKGPALAVGTAAYCLTGAAWARPVSAQDAPDPRQAHRWAEAQSKAAALERRAQPGRLPGLESGAALPLDVTFYGLQLELDPDAATLRGTAVIETRIGPNPLSTALLDLDPAMAVDSVRVDGAPVAFTHAGDDLLVPLGRVYVPGEAVRIDVSYGGVPSASGALHFDTRNGQPLIWTLSEPFGARSWWPCQDAPGDKADSCAVDVTVPSALTAVSNGTLVGTTAGPGATTFHWRERYPITPYLVSVTAHPYTALHTSYTPLAGPAMPVTLWSFADQAGLAAPIVPIAVQVLQRFAGLFGEYPFVREKYDLVQFPWGGGMEHQTATSMCCWSVFLTAHETAHQWFGDAVTCHTFEHIWLNEGFATYCEALWDEGNGGLSAYASNIWANRFYGNGTIVIPPDQATNFGRIFDPNLSYNKASWVLHMLRGVLGDAVFFDVLRAYRADVRFAYGTATTEDFQAVAEAVSGRDLANFFTQWLYQPYFPSYLHSWTAAPQGGGWRLDLSVEQLQTQGVYDLPVQVQVNTAGGSERFTVDNNAVLQSFALQTTAQPLSVTLDPDRWILCTREAAVTAPAFDRGLLVVNGVSWAVGSELSSAFTDSVFSAGYAFDFWDEFAAPGGGYPPGLPVPLGHGALPAELLGRYATVVWAGDSGIDVWNDTSIVSYLRAGGNLLLLARRGQEFLHPSRSSRLGLRWAEIPNATLGSASAVLAGLVPMTPTAPQTGCAVFETTFDAPATLLLTEPTGFAVPRGLAAWRHVPAAAAGRPQGGHFAFVSGRPYRWAHGPLRTNVRYILEHLFGGFSNPADPGGGAAPRMTRLLDPVPNPFNPAVRLRWELAARADVHIDVYDSAGRRVRRLLAAGRDPGPGEILWNGRDDAAHELPSGLYVARLQAAGAVSTVKLTLLR